MQNASRFASFASFAWASLHTPVFDTNQTQVSILNSLRAFYYKHTFYACADFDVHVRCFHVSGKHLSDQVVELDLSRFSPVTDALVFFYSFDTLEKMVQVWGALLFEQLEEKLRFETICAHRRCALSMRDVVELEKLDVQVVFKLPAPGAGSLKVKDSDLVTKLDWYMDFAHRPESGVLIRPSQPFSSLEAEVDCMHAALAISYQILHDVPRNILNISYDGRILCNSFRRIILNAELGLLKHRLTSLHENDLCQVLESNGYEPIEHGWNDRLIFGQPAGMVHQSFVQHYPSANVLLCKRWLLVPFEQLPAHVNFVLVQGGLCILPVYWEAVLEWQSFVLQTLVQREFLKARVFEKQEGLEGYAKHLIKFLMSPAPAPAPPSGGRGSGAKYQNQHAPLARVDLEHGVFIPDIEDIWSALPPCMQQLKHNNRFPRNQERLYLIPTMWNGGFSMESINRFLAALNDKWPKSPMPESVKKRANAEALIKRNPGVHWCSNVILHTKEQRADTPHCPFFSVAEGAIDAATCGSKCAAHLGLIYPVRAPHKVIQVKLKGAMPTSKETKEALSTSAAPSAADAADHLSSSSSDDEETKTEKRRYIQIEDE